MLLDDPLNQWSDEAVAEAVSKVIKQREPDTVTGE